MEETVIRGRLYELPSGIPVLEVPEVNVLAYGTADTLAGLSACNARAGRRIQPLQACAGAGKYTRTPHPGLALRGRRQQAPSWPPAGG